MQVLHWDSWMGVDMLLSHMKSWIIFTRATSMCGGIPWALVRNWVWPPPTTAWIWAFSHRLWGGISPIFQVFSWFCPGLLPMVSSPLCCFLSMHPGIVLLHCLPPHVFLGLVEQASSWWSFLVLTTSSLCTVIPIGTILVFPMLNLALETSHHEVIFNCIESIVTTQVSSGMVCK